MSSYPIRLNNIYNILFLKRYNEPCMTTKIWSSHIDTMSYKLSLLSTDDWYLLSSTLHITLQCVYGDIIWSWCGNAYWDNSGLIKVVIRLVSIVKENILICETPYINVNWKFLRSSDIAIQKGVRERWYITNIWDSYQEQSGNRIDELCT